MGLVGPQGRVVEHPRWSRRSPPRRPWAEEYLRRRQTAPRYDRNDGAFVGLEPSRAVALPIAVEAPRVTAGLRAES
jgi:hypothetical protein